MISWLCLQWRSWRRWHAMTREGRAIEKRITEAARMRFVAGKELPAYSLTDHERQALRSVTQWDRREYDVATASVREVYVTQYGQVLLLRKPDRG